MSSSKLFTPLRIRDCEFANRMFIPPMDMFCAGTDAKVNDLSVGYYADYAHRAFGGIIQEATAVTREGRISPSDLGIWDDSFIPGLKRIVDLVHFYDTKIGIQIAHAGRKGSTYTPGEVHGRQGIPKEEGGWDVVGPTETPYDEYHNLPHGLTKEEIKQHVQYFADAAHRAVLCGYDFIEIHAAHGYLIHEFLSPLSNTRDDEYGGSFENRTRFLKEICVAVRKVIPEGMPLFVRISMSDFVEESSWALPEAMQLCKELTSSFGVDFMDLSSAGVSNKQVIPANHDFQIVMAHEIKKATGVCCSCVGGIASTADAVHAVDELGIDVVEIGKAALRHAFNPRAVAVDLQAPIPPVTPALRWASRIPHHAKY